MLLTQDRIEAMGMLNRFNGWTKRPYSVLEHSVIGAAALKSRGYSQEIVRAFLIHDMEETEFGEIITPVKAEFMPPRYHEAVRIWEQMLCDETGVSMCNLHGHVVKHVDALMLAVETDMVFKGEWRGEVPADPLVSTSFIRTLVGNGHLTGDVAVNTFWALWA